MALYDTHTTATYISAVAEWIDSDPGDTPESDAKEGRLFAAETGDLVFIDSLS